MAGTSLPARRHLAFEELASTNTRALEAARAGDPGPLWITAERQADGRGRRGRSWASPTGNLYATLLLVDPAPIEDMTNLPLVAALGVRDGLASVAGIEPASLHIKWPNDVLANGAKTAGILLEGERLAGGQQAVAIGCGVNVDAVPADTPYPVTGLRRQGATASLAAIFVALAEGLERALQAWRGGSGFAEIRQGWLRHAVGVGEACRINLSDRSVEGRFLELDRFGRLVLLKATGETEAFSAGDLFLLGQDQNSFGGSPTRRDRDCKGDMSPHESNERDETAPPAHRQQRAKRP